MAIPRLGQCLAQYSIKPLQSCVPGICPLPLGVLATSLDRSMMAEHGSILVREGLQIPRVSWPENR